MFSAPLVCPATCELCGQWMPRHSDKCPRSGVHPSQWTTMNNADPTNLQEYNGGFFWSHTNSLPARADTKEKAQEWTLQ